MKFIKCCEDLGERAEQEYSNARAYRNTATIEYIAMMTDVDIETGEGEIDEQNV